MLLLTKSIQAYKLCSTGKDELDLSYECLTSEKAKDTLAKRIAASPEFAKTLQRPETMQAEDDEDELDENDPMDEVTYDEIDSSRMVDEEVEALILQKPGHLLMGEQGSESDNEDIIVGAHMEKYTGHEFSSRTATNWWVEWDAMSHM